MHVRTVERDAATGLVRELYDEDLANVGYVKNLTKLYSIKPEVYIRWRALLGSIRDSMDLRRYELATLAAAGALRCRYCVAAHADVLESRFYTHEELEAISRDFRNAGLDPVDVAIMAFAEKVALHAYRVTPDDVGGLRDLGLSDEEIFEVALTAAARSFFSKSLDAMGAQPDEALAGTAALFDLIEMHPAD